MNNSGYSHITINGETVDLFFGVKADEHWFKCLAEDDDNDMMQPNGDITPFGIGLLVYGGYMNYEKSERRKPTLSIGVFTRHMDECMVDEDAAKELQKVVEDWRQSKYSLRTAKLIADNDKDENLKKKSSKSTRLNTSKH